VKATRISHFGPPEVLVYVDEPVPQPKAGEAVVEVHAAGVGPWDALMQEGKTSRCHSRTTRPRGKIVLQVAVVAHAPQTSAVDLGGPNVNSASRPRHP
jgi:NADPH:quinone reductase-like Zn-dependent oxidoreductase